MTPDLKELERLSKDMRVAVTAIVVYPTSKKSRKVEETISALQSAHESLIAELEQCRKDAGRLREAMEEIIAMEWTENNEWDGVERVIPEMCSIARAAIAKESA